MAKKQPRITKTMTLLPLLLHMTRHPGNIIASIKRDSTGKVISMPTYKQSDFLSQSDSIRFNMKSGKGLPKAPTHNKEKCMCMAK